MKSELSRVSETLRALRAGGGAPVPSRRDALKGLSLLAAAGVLWSCARTAESHPSLDARQREALLSEVCDLLLPATDSGPAASAIGVPVFLMLALDHGLSGTGTPATEDQSDYVLWLAADLDRRTGGRFLAASYSEKLRAVEDMDGAAFADRAAPTPWIKLKHLILIGYYTSEIGGAEVLRYEDVPGRFLGDVKIEPGMKALSNDWTGVKYG